MLGGLNRMLKVGFILDISQSWLGGVNYYRNLFQAVEDYGKGIELIAFTGKDSDTSCLKDFPAGIDILTTGLLTKWHPLWLAAHVCRRYLGKDFITSWFMKNHGITVLSHNNSGIEYPGLQNIAWIPDFQHKYLPEFFSGDEIIARDNNFSNIAKTSDVVLLSSHDAEKDFKKFYPEYALKARVLQFVPNINLNVEYDFDKLRKKYNLPKRFFFLPNQYWIHKNHKVVLEALKVLKQQIPDMVVVSTGNTKDYRVTEHYEKLQQYITDNHLTENYRILGLVPYEDVQALGQFCVAYINPSLFEGWSTVVEEAKYRGKRIILSNLPVHQEQAPALGRYFAPHDVNELANLMAHVWEEKEPERNLEKLTQHLEESRRKFAETYVKILYEISF